MISAKNHFSSAYYRGDLRLYLHCTPAGCAIDIAEPTATQKTNYHLEMLLQPRDETGWPMGSPRRLYEADVAMVPDPWSKFLRGFHKLPFHLSEALLSRCHIRLTGRILSADQATRHRKESGDSESGKAKP